MAELKLSCPHRLLLFAAEVTPLQQLWEALVNLFWAVANLIAANLDWLIAGIALFVWIAWWLWGVNWPKMWGWLARGAWVPLVLLMVTAAVVWSQLAPSYCDCLGVISVPNFWWQLGAMALLVCVALLSGAAQAYFNWTPAEIDLEPPAVTHGHEEITHEPH
jgi:hypothetical protein